MVWNVILRRNLNDLESDDFPNLLHPLSSYHIHVLEEIRSSDGLTLLVSSLSSHSMLGIITMIPVPKFTLPLGRGTIISFLWTAGLDKILTNIIYES